MATPTSTWGSGGLDDILSLALEKTGVDASPLPPPPPPLMLNGNRSVSYPGTVDDLFNSVSAPTTPHTLYTPSSGYQNTNALPGDYMPSPGSWAPNAGDHASVTNSNGGVFPQTATSNGGATIEEELAALLESTDADYLPTLDQQNMVDTNFLSSFPSTSTAPPLPTHRSQMMGDFDVLSLLGLDANGAPPPPPPSFSQTSGYMSPMRSTGSPSNTRSVMTTNRSVPGGMLRTQVAAQRAMAPVPPTEDDIEEDDDQYAAADTYANYKPTKLDIGRMHPDPVVESSSLSSVEPPQVWFDLKLPQEVIEERKLSSLQLEAVVYACQQHMNILTDGTRAGFLIGDGAGVGKGRTVAGIIYQNYLEGRKKAVWLSVSNDLKYDAQRDLSDIGAKKIKVQSLSKFQYGKISGKTNGRFRKGIIFSTYSALIGESSSGGKYRTRLNQLLHWLGPHFDGVIVFDECHKAKNLVPSGAGKPSKTGLTVLQLQKKLPKARVVYCSATGASEPRNMAYMSRLGIWGPGTQFGIFQDFIKAMERRGVGAMEIVAMDMKLRGMYVARQLSFSGVTFSIEDVGLSKDFIQVYDKAVEFWVLARKLFREAADLMDLDRKALKSMWGQFWGSHQRFFKYLCIASKVPMTIQLTKKAISEGKCVVIGLQSTGEARTLEQLGRNAGELPGFISTSKGVLESLVKRHFPCPSDGINWNSFDNDPTLPRSCRKRKIGVRGPSQAPPTLPNSPQSNEDSSSEGEDSDSAMETSSEEEEGNDSTSEEEDDEDGSSSSSETNGDLSFFGINEPWLQKCKPSKPKKPKTAPARKKKQSGGNFSIKPPAAALGARMKFNTKTLELEKVASPRPALDRMRSLPTPDIKPSLSSLPPYQPPQPMPPYQRQTSEGEQRSLIDVMSSSAMATGNMSGMRNVTVKTMKEELLRKIAELSPLLPNNSLDELINGLGGPSKVAEMTGRRGRVVILDDGTIQYQLRAEVDVPVDMMNIQEKQRFMRGDKNIAIISEAASSGISLQADRRAKNQRRRVHVTLELPWSADKAIQQFGRTHRSNQVSAPEYVFLISQLSGEQRFASTVAKRLESLGALTHGDRRATETRDLSRYNLDTKYGRQSLEIVLKSFVGSATPKIKSEKYDREFFDKARVAMTNVDLLNSERSPLLLTVEKESLNMSRFLNRLLGLPVELQNSVFSYFGDTLVSVIQDAKRCGKWDGGIMDFGASGERVEMEESREFVGDPAFGTATTELHRILVERGISFSDALTKLNTDCQAEEGFYLMKKARNDKHVAIMLKLSKEGSTSYMVHRPNTGVQARPEKLKVLLKSYEKCTPQKAEHWWNMQYDSSLTTCSHAFWDGRCKHASAVQQCQYGRRRRIHHVLTGSILGVWTQLEGVLNRHPSHNTRMQIFRVHSPTRRLVGILIPTACVTDLTDTLKRIAVQAAGTAATENTPATTMSTSTPSSSSSPAVITIQD